MLKALELKIPPLLLTVAVGMIVWLLTCYFSAPIPFEKFRVAATALLLVLGIIAMFFGVYSFKAVRTTVNPTKPEQASTLVTSGIYRFTRNPMYLGFSLVLTAWCLFLNNFYGFGVVIAFVLYLNYLQIIPEERMLKSLFGEEFNHYQEKVRRWI